MGFLGFKYQVVGFKNTPTGSTQGAIADAGPFFVYVNSEIAANKVLGPNANGEEFGGWDYTASAQGEYADIVDEYSGNSLMTGSVTISGTTYKNVISKDSLNGGITLTAGQGVNAWIFRSVSECTNDFSFIPPTPSATVTPSATPSPSVTPSVSVTPSKTPSVSITRTPSVSVTRTPSVSVSATPSVTVTPTISVTPSISSTPGASVTPSVSVTPSITVSVTPSVTPSVSISNTPGVSPTRTASATPSVSVTPSVTSTPSVTVTPSVSVTRTPSVSVSRTPSTSVTPSVTPSVSVSATPSVSVTPSKSVTPSQSALNLSGIDLYYSNNSFTNACNAGSSNSYYHDGLYAPAPQAGDRIYNNSNGSSTASQGYYALVLGGGSGDALLVNSSGYVQTVSNCDDYCVVEGTLISTDSTNSVAVQNLNINQNIHSKNITGLLESDNSETLQNWEADNIDGSVSTAQVVSNESSNPNRVWNFNDGLLKTTMSHLHIVKRGDKWKMQTAATVQIGDYFENINGELVEIVSITIEDFTGTVYKLNVETDDVYYANGILTHNYK